MTVHKIIKKSNQIEVYFFDIPDADSRSAMKAEGFRWNPEKKCWFSTNQNAIETLLGIFKDDQFNVVDIAAAQKNDETVIALSRIVGALKMMVQAEKDYYEAVQDLRNCDAPVYAGVVNMFDNNKNTESRIDELNNVIKMIVEGDELIEPSFYGVHKEIDATLSFYNTHEKEDLWDEYKDASGIVVPPSLCYEYKERREKAKLTPSQCPVNDGLFAKEFKSCLRRAGIEPTRELWTDEKGDGITLTAGKITWKQFRDGWKKYHEEHRRPSAGGVSELDPHDCYDAWRILDKLTVCNKRKDS